VNFRLRFKSSDTRAFGFLGIEFFIRPVEEIAKNVSQLSAIDAELGGLLLGP
jgi:hypothetical protein